MNNQDYMEFTDRTAVYPDANSRSAVELLYLGAGLAGEAGETAGILKKFYRGDYATKEEMLEKSDLRSEIGDTLWYMFRILYLLDLNIDDIIVDNVAKLLQREQQGLLKDTLGRMAQSDSG